jgi:hypothetical protein
MLVLALLAVTSCNEPGDYGVRASIPPSGLDRSTEMFEQLEAEMTRRDYTVYEDFEATSRLFDYGLLPPLPSGLYVLGERVKGCGALTVGCKKTDLLWHAIEVTREGEEVKEVAVLIDGLSLMSNMWGPWTLQKATDEVKADVDALRDLIEQFAPSS